MGRHGVGWRMGGGGGGETWGGEETCGEDYGIPLYNSNTSKHVHCFEVRLSPC